MRNICNIYKKDKYITTLNYSINEFKKEWYPNWTDDMIVSDVLFENPILDNGELREMTREELVENKKEVILFEGEKIVKNKLIKIEKPNTKQSRYWFWDYEKKEWIYNQELEKIEYIQLIEIYKAEILDYGFDFNGHRQRCRDKDITFMSTNINVLTVAKLNEKDMTITWYFEDNTPYTGGLKEMGTLMMYGVTFVQSVYDTENFFKTKVEPRELAKEEFENKRKEFHHKLAKML